MPAYSFSIWTIVLKVIALTDSLLSYFVGVSFSFDKLSDGQWAMATLNATVTPKGNAVLGDVATIIHNGLDFLAQFMTLLPAQAGVTYNAPTP